MAERWSNQPASEPGIAGPLDYQQHQYQWNYEHGFRFVSSRFVGVVFSHFSPSFFSLAKMMTADKQLAGWLTGWKTGCFGNPTHFCFNLIRLISGVWNLHGTWTLILISKHRASWTTKRFSNTNKLKWQDIYPHTRTRSPTCSCSMVGWLVDERERA